jgi:hypothetical protein
LGIVLIGYAFFGRGFAYVGIPPFAFIGEICLFAGIVSFFRVDNWSIFRLPVVWLLCFYMILGSLLSWSSFRQDIWPLADVARDSVIWLYGIFAILVSTFLVHLRSFRVITIWFSRWIDYHVVFIAFYPLILQLVGGQIVINGSSLFSLKPSDSAVISSAALCFWMLSLHPQKPILIRTFSRWSLWLAGALRICVQSRGAMVGVVSAVLLTFVAGKSAIRKKLILSILSLILILCFVGFANVEIETQNKSRPFSTGLLFEHVRTTLIQPSNSSTGGRDGAGSATRKWREDWWNKIMDYTFHGSYFWTGKGFGINLADSDGFQVLGSEANTLRSPHNGNMTILARMGVPSFLAWSAFLICLIVSFINSLLKSRSVRNEFLVKCHIWVAGCFLASMIQVSVDVFLEGPQGGIWFWSIIGAAISLIYHTKYRLNQDI